MALTIFFCMISGQMTVYCTIFDREGIESDGAQSESKLAAEAKLQDEQVAQGEPVTPGSEKDTG